MEKYHEGPPIIRPKKDGVLVLCPVGHFYHFVPMREWAGSIWESQLSDPAFAVKCAGTLPKQEEGTP